MQKSSHPFDFPLALFSGALLALSFPSFGHPAFAWIALVPLIIALAGGDPAGRVVNGVSGLRAFLLGLTTGVVYFVGTIYWTGSVVSTFGGLATPVAVLAMLLLALYLALYPALTALLMARLMRRAGLAAIPLLPAAWVTTEYARGFLFGGFPWVPLGNSQVEVLPVAQLASLLGVYGLSALVAFVNAMLTYALLTSGRTRLAAVAALAAVLMAVGGWGTWRLADNRLTREGTPLRVGLVQGNVAQEDKWDPRQARRIFTTYLAMSRDAVRRGAEFVIWPESSTPFVFEEDEEGEAALRDLARELGVPILFGSEQIDRSGGTVRLRNAAFLVGPSGETDAVYHKIHLVPFGEYVPFREWLYFVSPLVERMAEFAPGESVAMLPIGSHTVSTAICYEVVYPSLIRRAVSGGSHLLTTITNDAWYGRSSAPHQHFALASMRAIEQGRYLARAANTGISGVVDPYGRVVQQSPLFEQVSLVEEVRLLTGRTLYSRIGDLVAYVAMMLTAVALVTLRRRN